MESALFEFLSRHYLFVDILWFFSVPPNKCQDSRSRLPYDDTNLGELGEEKEKKNNGISKAGYETLHCRNQLPAAN
jgi:hypothetical protein